MLGEIAGLRSCAVLNVVHRIPAFPDRISLPVASMPSEEKQVKALMQTTVIGNLADVQHPGSVVDS